MTHKKYAFRDYNRIKNGPKSLSVVKIVIYGELHILYFSLDIQQIAGFLKKNRFFFSVTFKWILFLFWGTVSYNAPNKSTTAAFSKQIKKHETKQKANWWILQCITKRFLRVYATHYVESFRVFSLLFTVSCSYCLESQFWFIGIRLEYWWRIEKKKKTKAELLSLAMPKLTYAEFKFNTLSTKQC